MNKEEGEMTKINCSVLDHFPQLLAFKTSSEILFMLPSSAPTFFSPKERWPKSFDFKIFLKSFDIGKYNRTNCGRALPSFASKQIYASEHQSLSIFNVQFI